jgi:hypothetical protein
VAVAAHPRSVIGALAATRYLRPLRLPPAGSIACSPPFAVFLTDYLRKPPAMTPWLAQGWLMPLAGRCRACFKTRRYPEFLINSGSTGHRRESAAFT